MSCATASPKRCSCVRATSAWNKSFTELGLDSIVGVEWMKQVNQRYGTQIAALRVYDYPSVRSLAAHLLEHLPAAPAAALRAHTPARSAEATADLFAPLAVP
ncbi:acyl carrier protein, partial [Streptomyces sp. S9]|nr:acyl carrier protein [Streptomyces sp. S9]